MAFIKCAHREETTLMHIKTFSQMSTAMKFEYKTFRKNKHLCTSKGQLTPKGKLIIIISVSYWYHIPCGRFLRWTWQYTVAVFYNLESLILSHQPLPCSLSPALSVFLSLSLSLYSSIFGSCCLSSSPAGFLSLPLCLSWSLSLSLSNWHSDTMGVEEKGVDGQAWEILNSWNSHKHFDSCVFSR